MIHCRLHKNLSRFHILSHIDPAHALPTDFFKVRFSIILAAKTRSNWAITRNVADP